MKEQHSLTTKDLHLFSEGTHTRAYQKLGAHPLPGGGYQFAVWAPSADTVAVIGSFNDWNSDADKLSPVGDSGIWQGGVDRAGQGDNYKYFVSARGGSYSVAKADPYGYFAEQPPATSSTAWDLGYEWGDGEWMEARRERNSLRAPMSIYEVHLGSWKRVAEDNYRSLNYREIAPQLAEHAKRLGFTHVELLPVMEHPFFGSWGYQTSGYFAPSSRFGTPQDFMFLVDTLHQRGLGVILDWVPSHFPRDEHSLAYFDGTHLYEHEDPRQRIQPDWDSYIFNYGRHEVRSFLISSAMFWLDRYHADGLRVDAVASMLYLDYSRRQGEWVPNRFGGRENLEAVDFLKQLNESVYGEYPDVVTIAEESTAWPMVSRPTYLGGLGFGLKWDMGWMHDTLQYMSNDPAHRKFHHGEITFRSIYAFHENFVLPLSHDEVVHGKRSLLEKMPGDDWQKFANLRLLLSYMWLQPGKKTLFMGGEFGQRQEWNHDAELQWTLRKEAGHAGVEQLLRDLNTVYADSLGLYELDCEPQGFEWLDASDAEQSTLSFLRKDSAGQDLLACLFNFTPVPRHMHRVGVPEPGEWQEVFNSDALDYGGSGQGNLGRLVTSPISAHGHFHSLVMTLPPLSAVVFRKNG